MSKFLTPFVTKTIVTASVSMVWDYFAGTFSSSNVVLLPVFGGGYAVPMGVYNGMLQGAIAFWSQFFDTATQAIIPNNIRGIVLERSIVAPLGGAMATGALSALSMMAPQNPIVQRTSPPDSYMKIASEAGGAWGTQFIGTGLTEVIHAGATGRAYKF